MKVNLTDLVLDFDVYPRNDVSSPVVTALCDAMLMGDPIPPIVVDEKSKRIVDGFHRYRAHERLKIPDIDAIWRTYKNEAELFADAVRLNRTHGRAFDPNDIRRAVQKLANFGLKFQEISQIVRVPKTRVEEFTKEFAKGPGASNIVVKQGLIDELKGKTLTQAQVTANEKWSGYRPTFHVNQLLSILKAGIIPKSPAFYEGMTELVELWRHVKAKKSA